MLKQYSKKVFSLLLVFCFAASFLNGTFGAVEAVAEIAESSVSWEDVFAGVADPRDLYDPISESDVPQAVGYETALEMGHVQRLYGEETDLNTVLFLNADGSKTMYTFDYPVKYETEIGTVADITLEIEDSSVFGEAFQSATGTAVTSFSTSSSDGIRLSDGDTDITLIPLLPTAEQSASSSLQMAASSQATRVDGKTVSYSYDSDTSIEYSLTYTGFKEDIVVDRYTGQTEYSFMLQTDGLALSEEDGSYYLVDGSGNIKASLGDIIIFTAGE